MTGTTQSQPAGDDPIPVGLIGFGAAGSVFHGPLISAEPRLTLAAVASSRPQDVRARYPDATVHPTPEQLIADPALRLVVVASPDATHFPLARAALQAGKHVVVDKPMAMSAAEGTELVRLAQAQGRMLTVFQNRRWDGDFLTVRELLASGRLGDIRLAVFNWDRYRPQLKPGWREHSNDPWGALLNLGPHLVDQVLLLFGPPEAVTGDVAMQRPGSATPDYFAITLHYAQTRVVLNVSSLVVEPRPRFELHGTLGSFVKYGVDPQEERLRAGMAVGSPELGIDPESQHGRLTLAGQEPVVVPTRPGDWRPFYAAVAAALDGHGPMPVDPMDSVRGLEIIGLARRSADEGRTLRLG